MAAKGLTPATAPALVARAVQLEYLGQRADRRAAAVEVVAEAVARAPLAASVAVAVSMALSQALVERVGHQDRRQVLREHRAELARMPRTEGVVEVAAEALAAMAQVQVRRR